MNGIDTKNCLVLALMLGLSASSGCRLPSPFSKADNANLAALDINVQASASHSKTNQASPDAGEHASSARQISGLPWDKSNAGSKVRLASASQEQQSLSSPNDTRVEGLVEAITEDPLSNSVDLSPPADAGLTLDDFLNIAMNNNPSLRELVYSTQKAAGFREQVGLRPNPLLGYQAIQLADEGTDQHVFFAEREFVTGQKLSLNRGVLNQAVRAQQLELEAQRFRVATDVKLFFYEALAEQQRIQLISDFLNVMNSGVELARLRADALEGTKVDLLQTQIQRDSASVDLAQARARLQATFKQLAAVSGRPKMDSVPLVGTLPERIEPIDWQQTVDSLVIRSPEYQAAQARVARARANINRQTAQPIPNLRMQLGTGFDNATDAGLINLQVGAPIPVHNKNQGNISGARAEYCRAVAESERIAAAIHERVGAIAKAYDSAAVALTKYVEAILPAASETLDLAEAAYEAGESNFLQLLVTRQTFFETRLEFLAAREEAAKARARVDGFTLTGALQPVRDDSGDASLRGDTFSQE